MTFSSRGLNTRKREDEVPWSMAPTKYFTGIVVEEEEEQGLVKELKRWLTHYF